MELRWTDKGLARHYARVPILFALVAGWLGAVPVGAATVQRVIVEDGRIVIRFDDRVRAAASFLLDGPRRIAVDIDGATPGRTAVAGGAIGAIRQGRHAGRFGGQMGEGTRIVFELTEPALVARGDFAADGRALTLSLRPVDANRFARASMSGPATYLPFGWGSPAKSRYRVVVPVPPRAKAAPLPRVSGEDGRPLVVIDAGHGGLDPGAISATSGLREKDVTLKIARAIRDELLEGGRVRVALTRDDDRYLVLRERYGVARRLHAALFISVHCDSVGQGEASGASVYTLSEVASDKESARLAARENKADVIAGVDLGGAPADVSSILIDLTQRETMNNSAGFARLLGREARPLMPLKADFHRMASLMVLKAPDMPSILFETGYISNPTDAAFLDSSDGRKRIAESVRRAVEVHFARRMAAR